MTRVALYARASTGEQVHSAPGQFRELRDHAKAEGLEIVAEVADEGEKRHTLERPGIEELRHYAASGEIEEVWAWSWDRYGEFPMPDVLTIEMQDYGVSLRSLDDGGGGEASFEMNVIKSLFSRREQRERVKRSRRGRTDKAQRGEVFGGHRPRYGFSYVTGVNQRGRETNVGYQVEPEQMANVVSIFEGIAAGESIKAQTRRFEDAGIPNPSGGPRWSETTIKNTVNDDLFRPHTAGEVKAMVSAGVAAELEPGREYGIHWSGRKRSKFKSHNSKKRVVYETPPEEWTAVPVDLTGSGLDRATVDRARARIAQNQSSAKVGDRFWELSGGLLKCADCGRAMIAYRRAKKHGYNHYYRCRPGSRMDREACPNRKSHNAEELEERAWTIISQTAEDKVVEQLWESYRAKRAELEKGGGRERRAALTEQLSKIETKKHNFWEMGAEGDLPRDVMRQKVADLEEEESRIRAEMEATEDAEEQVADLEASFCELLDLIEGGYDSLYDLSGTPEERNSQYRRMGVAFTVDSEGTLKAQWALGKSEGRPLLQSNTMY